MKSQPMHHFHFCLFFPVDRGSHALHAFVARSGLVDELNEGLVA